MPKGLRVQVPLRVPGSGDEMANIRDSETRAERLEGSSPSPITIYQVGGTSRHTTLKKWRSLKGREGATPSLGTKFQVFS